jgi:hypothetical protein
VTPRLLFLLLLCALASPAADPAYRSPYRVNFTFSDQELLGDLLQGPRADPRDQSTVPFREWYAESTRRHFGFWGPPAKPFPAPPGLASRSPEWKRQRVIATGLRLAGYTYQHHHLPDWDPPADWPRDPLFSGQVGKGLDCSNFTAFAYNLGLGIKFTGAVKEQAEITSVAGPAAGRTTPLQRLEIPADYADFERALHTGDLLFVKNRSGAVSHVVLWVGQIGTAPEGVPLILDSTSEGAVDSDGHPIPSGIQLRPFKKGFWYASSASHILRIIPDGP